MMKKNHLNLWKETGRNLLWACVLFGGLLGLLYVAEMLWPSLSGKLLAFHDLAFCVGIPASIIGVAYILSIKNPANYTGFYAGIVMSALLGIQFAMNGLYDLTFLYFILFIPFQVMSIRTWVKSSQSKEKQELVPQFLGVNGMLFSLLFCVLLIAVDYVFATLVINNDSFSDNSGGKIISGIMIASSILANYWLIYKKNDSWIYWLVYSAAGIALNVLYLNVFSIVLFVFFLIINGMAAIAWFKTTSPENFGWLRVFYARKA